MISLPPPTSDPLEKAWLDYYLSPSNAELILDLSDGSRDHCPVKEFFRDPQAFDSQDCLALELCQGQVLDVGAGCGCHSLYLQSQGISVCALDRSPIAIWIMAQRGVQCLYHADIFSFTGPRFDTLLLLMNGIGLVGSLGGLRRFLHLCHRWVGPQGQILMDSTDLGSSSSPGSYPGELMFTVEYQGQRGDPFPWLFVDADTLEQIAWQQGWRTQVIYLGPEGQYLARLLPLPSGDSRPPRPHRSSSRSQGSMT